MDIMSDFARMTIHELAPLIERREVSPVEVTQEMLDRIDALDERLHAFVTVRHEHALDAARSAEQEIRRGDYRGPIHGLPLGIKDNIAVAGWPTTNASALMTDNITDYDSTVVARLRAAGGVIVGKNNLHEWAMGGTCVKSAFGSIHNPWNEGYVPGGSSGGSAAAVSASLIYGSVGTDNKGSIRMPAAYCGVVGIKPTYGLVSRFGQLPATTATTDHLGPIAKDVRDAALLLNVLAGPDRLDPSSLPSETRDYTAGIADGVAGVRIGVPRNFYFDRTTPEVSEAVERAIAALAAAGAEVTDVAIPSLQHMPLTDPAWFNEIRPFLLTYAREGSQNFADRTIWERVILGEVLRASDVMKALRLRSLIETEFQTVMREVDVLAMPTSMTSAFPIGETEPGGPMASGTTTLCAPLNLTGMPAVSVPCGFTAAGLPVGLTIAGRHWDEQLVLRVAYACEQATTAGYRAPPLA
jgi:aspartyl-tRNA(Asn)/glutamyl-tRNA(Gln) amidotransferase subunit A